jgi:hypothetical protein
MIFLWAVEDRVNLGNRMVLFKKSNVDEKFHYAVPLITGLQGSPRFTRQLQLPWLLDRLRREDRREQQHRCRCRHRGHRSHGRPATPPLLYTQYRR